jgi:excisionase family DNA binding protein
MPRVSRSYLRSWARQGRVAYIKVGRRLYFDKADLLELLRRCRVEARSDGAA